MKKSIFGIAIIAILAVIVVVNILQDSKEKQEAKKVPESFSAGMEMPEPDSGGLEPGDVPPDFELKTMDGKTARLSDYKGKKVLLNFWATWCPPCRAEMPHMERFYEQKAKEHNMEILAVNLTASERGGNKMKSIQNFSDSFELTFPILLDEEGDIGSKYQVIAIPTSYFIDTEGIIHQKITGPMDEEMMDRLATEMN